MKVEIKNKITLESIPSASGIEIIDKVIYIIGDDSPYLYCLDFSFRLLNKIELFPANDFSSGRIPKSIKPDLECLTKIKIDDKNYLMTAGSGSTSEREKAFLIDISDSNNSVKEISLSKIYESLRNNIEITDNLPLNIEGLVANEDNIFFFNRTNNAIIIYKLKEFFSFISNISETIPNPEVIKIELDGINDIRAGFSGADIFDNKIFFTSSVEDTDDPVLDGLVYGSFCGCLDLKKIIHEKLSENTKYNPIEDEDEIFLGKVESISVYKKVSETEFLALCVTDDDLGGSELLKISITL